MSCMDVSPPVVTEWLEQLKIKVQNVNADLRFETVTLKYI